MLASVTLERLRSTCGNVVGPENVRRTQARARIVGRLFPGDGARERLWSTCRDVVWSQSAPLPSEHEIEGLPFPWEGCPQLSRRSP